MGCESVAIHEAYQRGDLEALKALLGSQEIDLEYAIYHSPLSFVRTLLELGADPNARTRIDEFATPAQEAELLHALDAVEVLRKASE